MTKSCAAVVALILGHMVHSNPEKRAGIKTATRKGKKDRERERERAVMWRTHPSASHLLFYNSPWKRASLGAVSNTQH